MIGALLGAFGANALNQWWELRHDEQMERTRDRPLPAGRMTPTFALAIALFFLALGATLLTVFAHPVAALITVAVAVAYVLVYTPLKRITPWSLVPGAIVGAAPPLIGWVACTGELPAGAWALFGIVFAWQIPHFLAIDWVHRDDYARGGYQMTSVRDPSGTLTGSISVLGSLVLIAASLAPLAAGLGGRAYAVGALVLGIAMLGMSIRLHLLRSRQAARELFLTSLVYLPLLLALLILGPS
jgi:protoheme IX farnesyltransferase